MPYFTVSIFVFSFIALKVLNWKKNQGMQWKPYMYDIILDSLFIVIMISGIFEKVNKTGDIDTATILLFIQIIVFPWLYFYLKKLMLIKLGFPVKWYYPLNDIAIIAISFIVGLCIERWF